MCVCLFGFFVIPPGVIHELCRVNAQLNDHAELRLYDAHRQEGGMVTCPSRSIIHGIYMNILPQSL